MIILEKIYFSVLMLTNFKHFNVQFKNIFNIEKV